MTVNVGLAGHSFGAYTAGEQVLFRAQIDPKTDALLSSR